MNPKFPLGKVTIKEEAAYSLALAGQDAAFFIEWFRQRPQLLMQAVVPISRHGNTVELHAWYPVHVLRPRQGPIPTE